MTEVDEWRGMGAIWWKDDVLGVGAGDVKMSGGRGGSGEGTFYSS